MDPSKIAAFAGLAIALAATVIAVLIWVGTIAVPIDLKTFSATKTYTMPTAYPTAADSALVSGITGTMGWKEFATKTYVDDKVDDVKVEEKETNPVLLKTVAAVPAANIVVGDSAYVPSTVKVSVPFSGEKDVVINVNFAGKSATAGYKVEMRAKVGTDVSTDVITFKSNGTAQTNVSATWHMTKSAGWTTASDVTFEMKAESGGNFTIFTTDMVNIAVRTVDIPTTVTDRTDSVVASKVAATTALTHTTTTAVDVPNGATAAFTLKDHKKLMVFGSFSAFNASTAGNVSAFVRVTDGTTNTDGSDFTFHLPTGSVRQHLSFTSLIENTGGWDATTMVVKLMVKLPASGAAAQVQFDTSDYVNVFAEALKEQAV